MDRPVAMKSNLHSVLFETTTTRFWVANASKDGKPAAEQPYHAFKLRDLLAHQARYGSPRAARHRRRLRRRPSGLGTLTRSLAASSEMLIRFLDQLKLDDIRESILMRNLLDCRGCWLRPAPSVRKPRSRNPRKSTCAPRKASRQSRESGGTTTSRSSRSTARAPTASPTRPTTSSPGPRRPISTTASGRRSPPRRSKDRRSTGQVCFCWYRIKITIPPEAAGKAVFFQTTVDDYGEIWVDGKPAAHARQRGRGRRRRLQRAQPRRAQGSQARQGLPDRGLRHQRTDLGRPVQLDFPGRHLPRDR